MRRDFNIQKVVLYFTVIALLAVFSANTISYLNFDKDHIEFLGDFDFQGSNDYDQTDLSEDVDSIFHQNLKFHFWNPVSMTHSDQYLLYDHFIPGINTPPPEVA